RRHTRSKRDWSSDVCSSDLVRPTIHLQGGRLAMPEETSTFRLYLMRLLYLGNFVGLGLSVWPEIINHEGAWDPVRGVAFCFWAEIGRASCRERVWGCGGVGV